MSKLTVDQKSVYSLLSDKKAFFLIPDYQRPYAWGADECETLWNDLLSFALPNNSSEDFDTDSEYFLGSIVTFKDRGMLEVIDGQQRLTTLVLLLRAFYSRLESAKDSDTKKTYEEIAACIWKTDEFGNADKDCLKISSEVALDAQREELLSILKAGDAPKEMKSLYAKNYRFFCKKIAEFLNEMPVYAAIFPMRILKNVILLPIEAESQLSALRIFSTLNDRGLPLADADIFKSQLYSYYSDKGEKDSFIDRWKALEEGAEDSLASRNAPLDELFTRYMYYLRAKDGIKDTTTQGLRDFFSADGYKKLRNEKTLSDLESLLVFWQRVRGQICDSDLGFSERVLKSLFVLNYAPNRMWTYLVSVWFLSNRTGEEDSLEESSFYEFLQLITGFILAYFVERGTMTALRGPAFPEMVNIVNHTAVTFAEYRFDRDAFKARLCSFDFSNSRPVTKSLLAWWAFQFDGQPLLSLDVNLQIEHIYAKRRAASISPLANEKNLDSIGNKSILEKTANIRASDYRFEDKKKLYVASGTQIKELQQLARNADAFGDAEIEARKEAIIEKFLDFLDALGLLKSA